ncbi:MULTISPECIES: hypothetical protein [unclassified Kitasatospora]|uniref:hypothetical protein n=1 Tax=unclassified Kitasatospora TaxID=2633591 RepID=UPI002E370AD7|nr:hypothetical protein [Kitasatospora sp. NBC_01246]
MTKSPAPRRHLPTSPFRSEVPPPLKQFEAGDRVTHDQYGLGRIISTETAGQGAVLVDFGSHQVRVVQPYDKLFKL